MAINLRRLIARLRRGRLEAELADEIQYHIERRTQALIDDGMDPRDAAFEARRMFGRVSAVRETSRDLWSYPFAESILADASYGARVFGRHPVVSLVALVSIAVAIAAGTAVFGVMNAAMFRPLQGGAGGTIYRVFTSSGGGARFGNTSFRDYESIAQLEVFAHGCAMTLVRANLRAETVPRPYTGQVADPACFSLLRLVPTLGRFYDSSDTAASPVIVSHRYWQRELKSDPAAAGRPLFINGAATTIVGVGPRGFTGTSLDSGADFWVPAAVAPSLVESTVLTDRRHRGFMVFTRLRDGATREQASAALDVLANQLRLEDPVAWTDAAGDTRRFTMLDEREARFASSSGAVVVIVGSVAGIITIVIAIACVNLATMLLALGVSRTREISVRLALGASSGRVLRQLITECLSIGFLGAILGLLTVYVAREVILGFLPPEVPSLDLVIDWRVAGLALLLGVVTPMLFGLAPAVHALRVAIAEGIAGGGRAVRVRRVALGAREGLIVVQVATSCALLLVSTLFARGLVDARSTSPGFRTSDVAAVAIDTEPAGSSAAERRANLRRVLDRSSGVPGTGTIAAGGIMPLTGSFIGFRVRPDDVAGAEPRVFDGNVVTPAYFEVLGIPLLAGRDFDMGDSAAAPPVVVVNLALSQALWRTDRTIGRTIVLDNGQRAEVVGIVGNTRHRSLGGADEPLLFVPFEQYPRARMVVHAQVHTPGSLAALERALRFADPRVLVERSGTVEAWLDEARMSERAFQWLGAAAGLLQFFLAVLGLWALVAYAVRRRSAEMGIRLALGATPVRLIALILKPSFVLILAGVSVGAVGGVAAASVLRSSASWLGPLDLGLSVPVSIVLTLTALFAAWLPARAVALTDPASALRRE